MNDVIDIQFSEKPVLDNGMTSAPSSTGSAELPRTHTTLAPFENLAVGAFGGALETCLQMPVLTYKFCLQEGRRLPSTLSGWYRGVGVQAGTVAPITALQLMTNGVLQRAVLSVSPSATPTATDQPRTELTDSETMYTAAGAGVVSAVLYSPVDLLTIQQQRMRKSLAGTCQALVRTYGIAGLFRGFVPCAGREAVYTAGYLGLAPIVTKHLLQRQVSIIDDALTANIIGACVAGTTAGLVTHPIDTIKTVLQSDMEKKEWKSMRQAFSKLTAADGVTSLYRGVVPRTFRLCGAFFVCLTVRDAAVRCKDGWNQTDGA